MWRKGAWGIADQGLISLTNFVTVVMVARATTLHEFGLYSLAFTGFLFVTGLQATLAVEPHTVLGAPLIGRAYVEYTTDTAWAQVALSLTLALLTTWTAFMTTLPGWQISAILFALVPATFAWPLQNFVRRALYTKSKAAHAFTNDVVSHGGQLVSITILWLTGYLTPERALLALGAGSAAGTLLGLWQIREYMDWTINLARLHRTVRVNWQFGKWLLGGSVAYWTSGQIYAVFAAGLVSVTATGVLRATQTVMGPTNVLMTALDPLFGPEAARRFNRSGQEALRDFLRRIQALVLVAMGIYCVGVAVLAGPILRLVFGPQYSQYRWMLVLVALTTLADSFRSPIKIGLKALGQTRPVFRMYLASSLTNLSLGLGAVYTFGFKGVAFGLVLNSIVLQIMMWHYWSKFIDHPTVRSMGLPSTSSTVT